MKKKVAQMLSADWHHVQVIHNFSLKILDLGFRIKSMLLLLNTPVLFLSLNVCLHELATQKSIRSGRSKSVEDRTESRRFQDTSTSINVRSSSLVIVNLHCHLVAKADVLWSMGMQSNPTSHIWRHIVSILSIYWLIFSLPPISV